jgi:hypothetical protein
VARNSDVPLITTQRHILLVAMAWMPQCKAPVARRSVTC